MALLFHLLSGDDSDLFSRKLEIHGGPFGPSITIKKRKFKFLNLKGWTSFGVFWYKRNIQGRNTVLISPLLDSSIQGVYHPVLFPICHYIPCRVAQSMVAHLGEKEQPERASTQEQNLEAERSRCSYSILPWNLPEVILPGPSCVKAL